MIRLKRKNVIIEPIFCPKCKTIGVRMSQEKICSDCYFEKRHGDHFYPTSDRVKESYAKWKEKRRFSELNTDANESTNVVGDRYSGN